MRRFSMPTAVLIATLTWALAAAAHPPAGHVAIRAGRTFDGAVWIDGAVVVLHGERIQSVRRDGTLPPGVTVIDEPHAVLSPGLVDLDSALGLGGRRDEWHEALSPDLKSPLFRLQFLKLLVQVLDFLVADRWLQSPVFKGIEVPVDAFPSFGDLGLNLADLLVQIGLLCFQPLVGLLPATGFACTHPRM